MINLLAKNGAVGWNGLSGATQLYDDLCVRKVAPSHPDPEDVAEDVAHEQDGHHVQVSVETCNNRCCCFESTF